ncbi:SDR family oxidoreductase [Marinococcus luteus]|uniref:SDR family oxidoreductase n=1 Tax=Marinococcus luteus TaxID=1122204 RepID=UPI002ACC5A37|nr:SDR family oxidoreductase [Marinococcus luteus]MDZ5781997.1 SDR family oxidoreductase [Marinococcus luteus]
MTQDPRKQYYHNDYPKQYQDPPGVQKYMNPQPDCGESSYEGTGQLKGRKALVTGGDSGIGRAAAIAYAREGADVAINYLPDEEPDAQDVKEMIEQAGRKAVLLPGDLRSETFSRELVQSAVDELGGLDILALVAGKQQAVKDIADLTTEQIVSTFETNVFSMYWMTQEALPHMPEGGSIITTTSVEGYDPSPMLLDYAATKSTIIGFTKALAKQVASQGIRVNSVAPGPFWSPLQISGGQPAENVPKFGEETPETPLGRAGQPAELSGIYVFLASDQASYVTGHVYSATGGLNAN